MLIKALERQCWKMCALPQIAMGQGSAILSAPYIFICWWGIFCGYCKAGEMERAKSWGQGWSVRLSRGQVETGCASSLGVRSVFSMAVAQNWNRAGQSLAETASGCKVHGFMPTSPADVSSRSLGKVGGRQDPLVNPSQLLWSTEPGSSTEARRCHVLHV